MVNSNHAKQKAFTNALLNLLFVKHGKRYCMVWYGKDFLFASNDKMFAMVRMQYLCVQFSSVNAPDVQYMSQTLHFNQFLPFRNVLQSFCRFSTFLFKGILRTCLLSTTTKILTLISMLVRSALKGVIQLSNLKSSRVLYISWSED